MADGALDRDVGELLAGAGAAQEQAAAAHVAAADEIDREAEALAEDFREDVDVFRRRDAAEQDDVAVGPDFVREGAGAGEQRAAIAGIVGRDVDAGERAQRAGGDARSRPGAARRSA